MSGPVAVEGSSPYAWPFDGVLTPERTALVVAGAHSAWSGRCPGGPLVRARIARLSAALAAAGVLVVRIRHDGPWARWPGAGPDGEDPWEEVGSHRDVHAGGIDGFFASPLDEVLRAAGRDRLGVCGFGLEGPVHSTLRSANDRGYECLVLTDASAALEPDLQAAAISTIEMSGGIFGAVGTASAFLAAVAPGADLV